MGSYLRRALLPSLSLTLRFAVVLFALNWLSLNLLMLIFAPILAFNWYFMEVDLENIKGVQNSNFFVCVVGSGFSGICAGIKLKMAGIKFVIIEKGSDIGGTWWYNHYPGCGVDIRSCLYQYSFFMNTWTRTFATRIEIFEYIKKTVQYFGIAKYIRLNTKVIRATWLEKQKRWEVVLEHDSGCETIMATHIISACGPLTSPNYPDYPGMDKYKGKSFHSQQWDDSYDYSGKRVAIIGSAASAVQIGPAIIDSVKSLHVFQRSPNWMALRPQVITPKWMQDLMRKLPFIEKFNRLYIFLQQEIIFQVFFRDNDSIITRVQKWMMTKNITGQLEGNEELIEKMTPNYGIGCKRILLSQEYLPMFVNKKNAFLVTDHIKEMTEMGIITEDGQEREFDLIVYATGFSVGYSLCGFDAFGRNGTTLFKHIAEEGRSAYYGTSVSNFPNFFLCIGPNMGLAHSSMIFMIECAINHVMGVLKQSIENGVDAAAVKEDVLKSFEKDIDEASEGKTYASHGCTGWYKHPSGLNRTVWPHSLSNFWLNSRDVNILRDYSLSYR